MPADAAACASLTSGTAAPARMRVALMRRGFVEAARKANDNAGNAAIANQQVRADADNHHRNIERAPREEIGEIVLIGRREEHLRRPANAQPRQIAERDIRQQPAAKVRRGRLKTWTRSGNTDYSAAPANAE